MLGDALSFTTDSKQNDTSKMMNEKAHNKQLRIYDVHSK